jgi:methylated-DNA-[protein]-cysteine S-methyltransferase
MMVLKGPQKILGSRKMGFGHFGGRPQPGRLKGKLSSNKGARSSMAPPKSSAKPASSSPDSSSVVCAFKTGLGWMAISMKPTGVERLRFGYPSRLSALHAIGAERESGSPTRAMQRWIDNLTRYAEGKTVSLSAIPVAEPPRTSAFASRVRRACRQIPYGETLTYGQLAQAAGSSGAARAVGTVMRKNETPLLVPCHRVLASDGIGGFSAVQGVATKERLLRLESGSLTP